MSDGVDAPDYGTAGFWTSHAAEAVAAITDLAGHAEYDRALDVSAGNGATALSLAGLTRHLILTSPEPAILARLRQCARLRGLPRVSYLIATADRLPCADASIDLVSCRVAAHHFHGARPALDEVVRVLRLGGVFILSDAAAPDEDWLTPDPGPRLGNGACRSRQHSPAAWCRLLEEHGLVVEATVTTRTVVDADERLPPARAADARAAGPGASGALPLPRVERVPDAARDAALNRFPWRGVAIRASKP